MLVLGLVIAIVKVDVLVVVVVIVVVDIASAAVRTAASMAWMTGSAECGAPAKLGKDEGTMGWMIGILWFF